jgi:hypothetical protein
MSSSRLLRLAQSPVVQNAGGQEPNLHSAVCAPSDKARKRTDRRGPCWAAVSVWPAVRQHAPLIRCGSHWQREPGCARQGRRAHVGVYTAGMACARRHPHAAVVPATCACVTRILLLHSRCCSIRERCTDGGQTLQISEVCADGGRRRPTWVDSPGSVALSCARFRDTTTLTQPHVPLVPGCTAQNLLRGLRTVVLRIAASAAACRQCSDLQQLDGAGKAGREGYTHRRHRSAGITRRIPAAGSRQFARQHDSGRQLALYESTQLLDGWRAIRAGRL